MGDTKTAAFDATADSYVRAVRKSPFALVECTGTLDAPVIAAWNDGASRIFGYSADEVIGQSAVGLIVSDAAVLQRAAADESGTPTPARCLRKDGSAVLCEWVCEPVVDAHGNTERLLCFGRDVTKQHLEIEALRERDAILRTILDNIDIIVCKYDKQGNFTFHEGKGVARAQLKPGQLVGRNVLELYGKDDQALRDGLAGQPRHTVADAHDVVWENWFIPLRDERGAPDGMVSVSFDGSSAKRREQELQAKLDLIERQQKVISDLSTPIIEVWDKVLTLPMVGVVDSVRTSEVMDNLLNMVTSKGARFAILDLTGVDAVDTQTASYLINLVRAIRLLGAEGIITGIRPNVAQTMVTLGLDLSSIVTKGNLRAGLKLCIQRMSAEGQTPVVKAPEAGARAPGMAPTR